MEQEIKVSVFCLAYNHEKYIRHTLDGFVMQRTNFKVEFLVHDDASTDSTAEIIREYEQKYPDIIKPIYETENQYSKGVHIIFDILSPLAKGKYIAFCEGDDYWTDPLKLQKQFDAMEQHPECSICVHKVQFIKEDGTLTEKFLPIKLATSGVLTKGDMRKMFWCQRSPIFQTSSYFISKNVFETRYNDLITLNRFYTGDITMLFCSVLEGKAYYSSEAMSHYRMFSIGSWTSNAFGESSPEQHIERYKKLLQGDDYLDDISQRKWHKQIQLNKWHVIADIAHFEPLLAKNLIKEYEISFMGMFGKISAKRLLQYLCIRFFPYKYKRYVSAKERKSQKSIVSID